MRSNRLKNILTLLIIFAAIVGFFSITKLLGSGEKVQSEKPFVICQQQNAPPEQQKCFWTAHIHATVKVSKSNGQIPIGFEKGALEGMHTHAETNRIHWHGLIPVDPKTREATDWSVLKVEKIPGDFKLSIQRTSKFIVNGKEVDPSYIWTDGDTIEIHYE